MAIRNQQTELRNPSDACCPVLVLVGPTASGKTAVSIELAHQLDGEIISADSRQVYKYLDIGTAKPTTEQRLSVPHHFIDEFLPNQDFNAGEFGERGRAVIDAIFSRKRVPIVVGGSGLYIQSLINGFFEGPSADKEFRELLQRRIEAGELTNLVEELKQVDPISAGRIDPTKPRRIVRALEVFHATGKPLSEHQHEAKISISFDSRIFGLEWERNALYERINRRCDEMIRNGLLAEVEMLSEKGYTSSFNALNTVGYAEVFAYRRKEISYEEMLRLFKQNSRRYAKRQVTWFRRDERITRIHMNEQRHPTETALQIAQLFRKADQQQIIPQ